jgi:hypothetical protein
VAHVAKAESDDDARAFWTQLTSSKKIASATHNILAWRLKGGHCGRDDDGEGGAGDRLLQLLERMQCENVAVVVTRYMNGPKLGAVRFAHICNVAREVTRATAAATCSRLTHLRCSSNKELAMQPLQLLNRRLTLTTTTTTTTTTSVARRVDSVSLLCYRYMLVNGPFETSSSFSSSSCLLALFWRRLIS